jgi:hypothetical protein
LVALLFIASTGTLRAQEKARQDAVKDLAPLQETHAKA